MCFRIFSNFVCYTACGHFSLPLIISILRTHSLPRSTTCLWRQCFQGNISDSNTILQQITSKKYWFSMSCISMNESVCVCPCAQYTCLRIFVCVCVLCVFVHARINVPVRFTFVYICVYVLICIRLPVHMYFIYSSFWKVEKEKEI